MKPLSNLKVYDDPSIVTQYSKDSQMLKGEAAILERYPEIFGDSTVLDIGVGGGRTTPALAALAKEYQALDYSQAMVTACNQRFSGLDNVQFFQDDARTLAHCKDSYFDAAIFSFNGIDTVDMEGRKAVLAAAFRVLKPEGYFVFSFHNAGHLDRLYQYQWSKNPFNWPKNIERVKRLITINGKAEVYKNKEYFFIKDGGDGFRTDICYTKPSVQLAAVRAAGFEVKDAFSAYEGKKLEMESLDQSTVPWIYLVCRKL